MNKNVIARLFVVLIAVNSCYAVFAQDEKPSGFNDVQWALAKDILEYEKKLELTVQEFDEEIKSLVSN